MNTLLNIIACGPVRGMPLFLEYIRLVLENTDINIQDIQGKTILSLCCNTYHNYNNIEVIKLLLKNGADVNIQDNLGLTAIMDMLTYIGDNTLHKTYLLKVSQLLLEYDATFNGDNIFASNIAKLNVLS